MSPGRFGSSQLPAAPGHGSGEKTPSLSSHTATVSHLSQPSAHKIHLEKNIRKNQLWPSFLPKHRLWTHSPDLMDTHALLPHLGGAGCWRSTSNNVFTLQGQIPPPCPLGKTKQIEHELIPKLKTGLPASTCICNCLWCLQYQNRPGWKGTWEITSPNLPSPLGKGSPDGALQHPRQSHTELP